MKRANFYIDGFNLYFGMVQAGYLDCKWLNPIELANRIKNASHLVNSVKYFSSRVNNNPEKQKRQGKYIDAILTTDTEIIFGKFRSSQYKCDVCGQSSWESKEKMTDVNIASRLLNDAYQDSFDVAYIISGDSDLVPPLEIIRSLFPRKELFVVFPPERKSNELKAVASSSFTLGHKKLKDSQFPNSITDKYGVLIEKPNVW